MKKFTFLITFLVTIAFSFLIMSFAKVKKVIPPTLYHSMYPTGITGVSVAGCTCHGPSVTPAVNVFISGLPATPVVGTTYSLFLNVKGTNPYAGFNVAVNSGTLGSGESEVQVMSSELTHTNPKALVNGEITFAFSWTPTAIGNATFTYAGNNVNGSGTGGDFWNKGTLNTSVTLPVTISLFNGININNYTNTIYWTAEREVSFANYEIENSCDGILFNKIGNVLPTATNANVKTYEFTHTNIFCTNTKNYYRLKLINRDGSYVYSNIITITNNVKDILPSLYPNPISIGANKLIVNVGNREVKEMQLISPNGSLLRKYQNIHKVINEITIPTNLPKGNYYIKIYFKNNKDFTLPFLY
jgi:hypothetical protein